MQMSIEEVLIATGGFLIGEKNNIINSVSTNSKNLKQGSLFVPIKGERVDSHQFINEAFKNGATASFTEHLCKEVKGKSLIKVKSSIDALQKLAEYYRLKFNIPVIGITGSVGKTTVKQMLSCIFSESLNIIKTNKNFNGQLGVPFTVFNIEKETDLAIIEMGISLFGEMERIVKIARPTMAVINNIGISHIEALHTKENILKEKFHIADFLRQDGMLFLNGDDDILKTVACDKYKTVFFGTKGKQDFLASNIRVLGSKTIFDLTYKDIKAEIMIPVMSTHDVHNALAAISVSFLMGVSIDDIKNGLSKYKCLPMRQEIYNIGDISIIDDTYNASPQSMKSAIDLLENISKDKVSIAVLADMFELGERAKEAHWEVGEYVKEKKIDMLITVGEMSQNIAKAAKGVVASKSFLSKDEAIDHIIKTIPRKCAVLVKGSRGMHMEQVVKKLIDTLKGERNEV